jgi:hypothetical protein
MFVGPTSYSLPEAMHIPHAQWQGAHVFWRMGASFLSVKSPTSSFLDKIPTVSPLNVAHGEGFARR